MTERFDGLCFHPRRAPAVHAVVGLFSVRCSLWQRINLTAPLLCSVCRRRLQVERPHQVHGGFTHAHLLDGCPEVDHVAFLLAGRLETMEYVLIEIHAERSAAAVGAVDRAGTAFLGAGAAQLGHQAKMFEDAGDRQLLLDVKAA